MSDRNIRRIIGGLSAFAVAAGFAVTAGVGVAEAAEKSVTWDDGNERITRTVSNATPVEGELVKVTTRFDRTGGVVEYIQAIKDLHPTCMTYVAGSARLSENSITPEVKPDYTRVTGSWALYPHIEPNSQTYEVTYKVGADCARGVPLMTTMHYSGTLGDGTYNNKGPAITVSKNVTTTSLAAVSGAQRGQVTTLAATVTGGAQGDPVDFLVGGSKVGSGSLDANGTATYAWTPDTRGTQTVMAKYIGTSKANASQSDLQSVDVAQVDAVSTTTIADVTGAQVGRASVLEATVSPAAAGGSVQFKDGGALLADVPVNGSGKVSYQWTPTVEGSHSISAVFSGRDGVAGSTGTKTVNVAAKPVQNTDSTTEISVGNGQAGVAQTISAQVANGAGGTVTFKDGDTVIGTATVDGNGRAALSWTPAIEGQRIIRAEYSGAGTVNASSDEMSVVIAAPATGGGDGGNSGAGSLGGLFGSLGG